MEALNKTNNNKTGRAKLQINRKTLYNKLNCTILINFFLFQMYKKRAVSLFLNQKLLV
jgi:hypothetical protein